MIEKGWFHLFSIIFWCNSSWRNGFTYWITIIILSLIALQFIIGLIWWSSVLIIRMLLLKSMESNWDLCPGLSKYAFKLWTYRVNNISFFLSFFFYVLTLGSMLGCCQCTSISTDYKCSHWRGWYYIQGLHWYQHSCWNSKGFYQSPQPSLIYFWCNLTVCHWPMSIDVVMVDLQNLDGWIKGAN
jgi:hypothetical protein